ncbi:VOC family protein [Paenibacillus segetis]|uniref:VOC domain-containing protein n=1 Tax=Paenibacillus segetis TaxID=1325360 RepID=A0ABQ1YEN0_9BACL|nr:ring-cleaving dioxygenase [Paenibacillus segetis]GGH22548.1 hypothetical protein GCM10008013_21060 [Paenibacillus segetis]
MYIDQVTLLTSKLHEMKTFYTSIVECELLEDEIEHFVVKIGSTNLTFKTTNLYDEPSYHFAINVPDNKFREVKDWVSSRVPLISEDGSDEVFFESWNADSIYCEDPSGNIVEFIARHHLKNGVTHSFSAKDFICISEVGIVADEVVPLVQKLNTMMIPKWKEGSDSFVPLGDEHGLLIVVKKDREWYFSNHKKAKFYPVEVSIKDIGILRFAKGDVIQSDQ